MANKKITELNPITNAGLAGTDVLPIVDVSATETKKILVSELDLRIAAPATTVQGNLTSHIGNTSNPHSVTKAQVGLGNVDNTSDINKPVSTAQASADAVVQGNLDTHIGDTANPHGVTKTQVGLSSVDNTADVDKPVSTAQAAADAAVLSTAEGYADTVAAAAQAFAIQRANHIGTQDMSTINGGNSDVLAAFDGTGNLKSQNNMILNADTGGFSISADKQPNGRSSGFDVRRDDVILRPLQDSPDETWHAKNVQFNIDPDASGFSVGSTGLAARGLIQNIFAHGTGNVGGVEFIQNNFSIGNGTDPITFKGFGYLFGFGQINDNVTVNGPLQGYGFQPNMTSGALFAPGQYVNAFYDNANLQVSCPPYTSFNASPNLASIANNANYNGLAMGTTIPVFTGNAGFVGIGIFPNLGTFDTGGFQGVVISPNIANVKNATGLNIDMNNTTPYPGVKASVTIQDLFIESQSPDSGSNGVTIEYVDDVLAGSETASLSGMAVTVHIQSGVSTATQVRAALIANFQINANLDITITGSGSNPQTTQGPTNLAGGVNPGNVLAANFQGDVQINGALSFTGALSIGKLSAYANYTVVDGGGAPGSAHTLICAPTVAANATIANADTLGLNTAALISIGDNATVTTAFLGIAALGLPAVLSMGTGSTVDRVSGATFALSLDASATGGTVNEVALCRALALPNGATTVNRLYGYEMALPFGAVGTDAWGVYIAPAITNYMAGSLTVGDAGDVPSSPSAGIEIQSSEKSLLLSRMSQTERDAMTAVNGMIFYNADTDKFQGYAAGAWVDLH